MSATPELAMAVKDPDGGKLRYEFEVYDSSKQALLARSGTSVTGVSSGTLQTWVVAGLSDGSAGLSPGVYYWRGRGCDTKLCGSWSSAGSAGMFEFTVKAAAEPRPEVSSADYPAGVWSGGQGVAGRFTFSPGSITEEIRTYVYALNGGRTEQIAPDQDGTATVTIIPERSGVNVLDVFALDSSNGRSYTSNYRFRVNSPPNRWYWSLDEGQGTTSASQPENTRPVTISGSGVTWTRTGMNGSAGSVNFSGSGEMTTESSVLDTTAVAGLSVGAWVRLPATEDDSAKLRVANQTAVSQDGVNRSMFRLGYRNDLNVDQDENGTADPAWCFSLATEDAVGAPETTACTTEYLTPGTWTHLVGVIDAIHGRVRLHVNGTAAYGGAESVVPGKALWQATKSFAIGRALAGGAAERWIGDIDEVRAVPRVWEDVEIEQQAHPLD